MPFESSCHIKIQRWPIIQIIIGSGLLSVALCLAVTVNAYAQAGYECPTQYVYLTRGNNDPIRFDVTGYVNRSGNVNNAIAELSKRIASATGQEKSALESVLGAAQKCHLVSARGGGHATASPASGFNSSPLPAGNPAPTLMDPREGSRKVLSAISQAQSRVGYSPLVGEGGKDVIYVPTPGELLEQMVGAAAPTANDLLVDLGSGDGRIPLYAALVYGIRAQGIEYNTNLVKVAQAAAVILGLSDKVSFVAGDLFQQTFSDASIVTMYLLPSLNLKLRPQLQNMRPGTRIVSHAFNMGDWWPDRTVNVQGRSAFLWIVGANNQTPSR